MPKPLPTEMRSDLFKLEQGALLELWEIDLRHISSNANPDVKGEIYRFHNGVSQTRGNIWWQGKEYQAYPIKADGFEISGQGPSNRPTLAVSNLYGIVTGIVAYFGQGVGGKVTRHLVPAEYLDAKNFPGGVNPTADPRQVSTHSRAKAAAPYLKKQEKSAY